MQLKQSKKMVSYCALTVSATSVASVSGQTVIFYGENASSPNGIEFNYYGTSFGDYYYYVSTGSTAFGSNMFSRSNEVGTIVNGGYQGTINYYGYYFGGGGSYDGGAVAGDNNYALINFNPGVDSTFEAVGQFFFDQSGGYLVAVAFAGDNLAINDSSDLSGVGGADFSIAAGAAAISGIPEPSSIALLALGAVGLLTRRQRKKVF